MWIEAQDAIQRVTFMKVRYVASDRMETYNPLRIGNLGGSVSKMPIDGDSYEIRADLWCQRGVPCDGLIESGKNLFNSRVTNAGARFEPLPVVEETSTQEEQKPQKAPPKNTKTKKQARPSQQ
ncbi:hypothetical protein [Burkholderia sp. PU8-34]